jgi:hypothetical protein
MMQFHPDKCEVISISRKKNPEVHDYTIHGHQLKHVNSVKYLGLTISHDLRWNKHVDKVVSKSNNTLNFLRRNLRIKNPDVKTQAYKSLVRPLLEYSSTVWDPHTIELKNKLEMVQRRAARYTLNRYRSTDSVTAMLKTLSWPTLAQRRLQARLTMMYKINHDLVSIDTHNYLSSKKHNTPTRTENTLAYHIPQSRTDYHRNSFYANTIRSWNLLPEGIVSSATPESFKAALCKHLD